MKRLRILLLAADCNPESISTPSIGYAHADALARLHDVTLVVRSVHEAAVRRAGGSFRAIEGISLPGLDRVYAWALKHIFKYDWGRQSLTAATYPVWVAFECRAWRRFRRQLQSGEYDVVLRILPLVSVIPSPFAYFLRRGSVPFVLGPLNGGLPWPSGFPQLDKQRQQAGYWVASLRGLYRYLPFARSTYAHATAIVAGSSHTYAEFARYQGKVFFVPGENGIDPALFKARDPGTRDGAPLQLIFVGRLIPLKACDLALRASADLLRTGAAQFTVVGDGPERGNLEQLARTLQIDHAVRFVGLLPTADTLAHLQRADVMVFPSLREFGGTVVFEALALGAVPVVADFGGPGDIVTSAIGYKVPLTTEDDMVARLRTILTRLAQDRAHLHRLQADGAAYARERLTWDGKARVMTDILLWAAGHAPKPLLPPPVSQAANP